MGLFNKNCALETLELENARVYPLYKASSPVSVKGALYHPDTPRKFEQLREMRLPLPGKPLSVATDKAFLQKQPIPRKKLDGHHLYAGPFFRHYGHFMAESVHRLWAYLDAPDQYEGVLVCPQPLKGTQRAKKADELPAYFTAIMQYFGVPADKVRLVNKPLLVERLTVPTQASTFGDTPPTGATVS
ncbi:glycosyltransferase family 61 protein [Kordiimonas aestuarii]|uniref:glycosyltransferase family 61 protein n=1 Tax=Kordiimonas aestuarii TaxID=1005925 RepID=UPI0021CE2207|nr:glycosyltransferase family 61 protein [Kordiimonas aestuarii]